MAKPKVLKRGKITYVIYDDKVVVGVNGNQWTSYNPFQNFNRAGITLFINKLKKSKETDYCYPADLMTLAYECDIIGIATRAPKDIE